MSRAGSRWLFFVLFIALAASSAGAAEDPYPVKPVRLVVPYPPGGGSDLVGRQVAQKLSAGLGQSIVVENRAGAAGNIGADLVAKSPPDGYTILLGGSSTLAVSPSLYAKLPFDSVKDFAHITMLVIVPNMLVAHPSLPVTSVGDLIKLAKRRAKEINFASQGNGSVGHLSGAMLNVMGGVDMVHVPYKGASPAITALISGETRITFRQPVFGVPPRSKECAHFRREQHQTPDDRPGNSDCGRVGFAGFRAGIWYSLLAPARTPRSIVDGLCRESVNVLRSGDLRDTFVSQGAEIVCEHAPDEVQRVSQE
ncbi:MAG: tripartite tricarboxylate transporter substrate binding protein [Burkholderiales bacterium]|nr:tripartite tricarboxylate transporter substrate binding protein [Burkholderiales bacterium]